MDEECESARLSYRAATRMGVAGPSASKSLHWSPAEKKERGFEGAGRGWMASGEGRAEFDRCFICQCEILKE